MSLRQQKISWSDPLSDTTSFRVQPLPSLWAFAHGPGSDTSIYGAPDIIYTTKMIHDNAEPPIAFWVIFGSHFADFNNPDNIARGILAKPNYGLVVIPTSDKFAYPKWSFHLMALGDTVGSSFVATLNNVTPIDNSLPNGIHRWFNIQGDPTLRLNTITPPAITSGTRTNTTITINWNAGESGSLYHVYRSAAVTGTYELLTTSGPISAQTWTCNCGDATKTTYMVRGVLKVNSGSGSYWNLSQGSIIYIP